MASGGAPSAPGLHHPHETPMAIELLGEPHRNPQTDVKGLSILARSLFRQMRQQGYSTEQIIGLSSELIQLVREDLQKGLAAE
jgi:hypothetical protein